MSLDGLLTFSMITILWVVLIGMGFVWRLRLLGMLDGADGMLSGYSIGGFATLPRVTLCISIVRLTSLEEDLPLSFDRLFFSIFSMDCLQRG